MRPLILMMALAITLPVLAQNTENSTWKVPATNIDPANYYGVTCANGMIGLVSSPNPMEVSAVVLNGVYDYYQRGRVSNILKAFNHVNMWMNVDDQRLDRSNISNFAQTLDMKEAALVTTFDYGDKLSVKHSLMALRHLPYTAMSIVEVTAKEDLEITAASVIQAPNHLKEVRNY